MKAVSIKIRSADIKDLDNILNLFEDTVKSVCSRDYNQSQIDAWVASVENKQHWLNKIKNDFFLVAEIGDQLAGFASLKKSNYLDLLFIHKNYLKQGVAKTLFSEIEKQAQDLGSDSLEADVSITAKPFFNKVGFINIKANHQELRGVPIANYRMIKKIQ